MGDGVEQVKALRGVASLYKDDKRYPEALETVIKVGKVG